MADMKSDQHRERDEVEKEMVIDSPSEDSSDRTSNPGSVGNTSMDDDPIVTPAAVAAAAANAAQTQAIKKTLSKQPSNGIHVLKPDGTQAPSVVPPYPNSDSSVGGNKTNAKEEEITFDPNGSYYMANACCELIHYRTGAIVVAIVEMFMISVWGYFMGSFYTNSGGITLGAKISIGVQPVVGTGFLIVIILMLIGIFTERPYLLWPHMLVQIFGIVLGIAFTVVAVIAMCAGTSLAESIFSFIYGAHNLPKVEAALGPIWPFCLAVVFDFGAALGIWFYIVIKGCYEYLMDKVFFEKEMHSLALKKESLDVVKKPQAS
jgi:hypothetical protein